MYEVEKIVASRINQKGKKEYQVKWVGYDHTENTWQPVKNLISAKDILDQWIAKEQKKGSKKTQSKSVSSHDKDSSMSDSQEYASGCPQESSSPHNALANRINPAVDSKTTIAPRRRGRPPKQDTAPKQVLKIIGVTQGDNMELIFKIDVNGKQKWVERSYLVPNYMLELIKFYEGAICFKN